MQKIKLWFGICRPRTLFASVCPVLMGLIAIQSVVDAWVALATLLCALSLQVLSNLINDYYDFKRGSDKAGRVGPARALAEGLVDEKQMRNACLIAVGMSVALGLYLVVEGGWVILAIGVLAILFAWLYTATHHSLSYLGIADIFCFLFYGPIASAGTAYLQVGCFSWTAFLLGCACGCIAVCVLATNNIRDIEDDRAVGKRTFAVRFGMNAARVGVALMLVAALLFGYWGLRGNGYCWLLGIPFAYSVYLYVRLLKAKGPQYNRCLFSFGLLNACYTVAAFLIVLLGNLG
ncbi:MAG: 1,4-dihydroxy-2-naphthoate octaprenyltransferase [Bacteroidales bacterium]|nr:1,4-dihydroxy-2-naphthoate octaprenyltransferase [Bacteroidales bacterium]